MFPMRDQLYELAQAREMELMEMARREQQWLEAQGYQQESWMTSLRRMWQRLSGHMTNGRTNGRGTSHNPTAPRYNVFQG